MPEAAKLILPHNNFHEGSLKKYAIRTLKAQIEIAQESKENVIFTLLNVDLFKKTKAPKPKLIITVNKSINPFRNNF